MAATKMKVLIVDDELIVRKGLRTTVPWERYGMEVVADASNGLKGWDAFLAHKPDVVITDIVMPKLNGLELARRIKQAAGDTQILLLSCHEDFSYAQQGFRLGASGYILKTNMDEDEMGFYLSQFQEQYLQRTGSSIPREADVQGSVDTRQAHIGSWLGGFSGGIEEQLRQWFAGDWSWMDKGCFIFLIRCGEGDDMLHDGDWQDVLREAGTPCERISCGKGRTLLLCRPEAAERVACRLKALKGRYAKLMWQEQGPVSGVQEWVDTVLNLYQQDELRTQYDLWGETWPDAIMKAVGILSSDRGSTLSVAEVAEEVGLSRSHFSTLFKRTVGENFIDFQSKIKLHKAEHMLTGTLMSVSEISDQLGMVDANYFSKWFKRFTGLTPSQYRSVQNRDSTIEEKRGLQRHDQQPATAE
ncbi:response regulator [Paenibacillus sp. KQZ6P-2]|uniref:Response regulator n=1 Tax=Paenibacillus mangrovi TaxID=2931978 RepID=A0A9X2B5E1_9BACL|nr:response regulator [Paenibacillus mangrovi]MCJ8011958.1 response regulator [Paenibacillus mangrovi]